MICRLFTYRPVTRFSCEQVTIVQLQGSTESWSQFLSTPWGSLRQFLIIMRACTAGRTEISTHQCERNKQRRPNSRVFLIWEKDTDKVASTNARKTNTKKGS
jgi:hypothetical protein